jgi:opacity protein-like surface antigen
MWIAGQKAVKKQILLGMLGTALVIGAGAPARAQSGQSGFYGGVSMREGGATVGGLVLGDLPLVWNRFTPPVAPVADDSNQRSLVFGGYRWANDVAVEAAINTATTDQYALRPSNPGPSVGPGLGLSLQNVASRSWNADVYTSWEMIRRLSLYGRLGYAQSDLHPLFSGASLMQSDPRRQLTGVNYGVGLRYDVTHSLGLRVEYARFGRFAGETPLTGGMSDSDQLTIGVQYRF